MGGADGGRDGHDVRALGDEPGEGDVRRSGVDPVGDFADLGREVEVGPPVVLLEARQMHPLVVLRQFVEGGEASASPTRPRSSAPCSSSRISKSPASQMIYMPDAAHYQPEQPHRP
ncbi:hypothetical protein ACGFZQ_32705 [Streptomyces sp. NPDC048254]|uniref:hypothetical protein n=1 Tax=Streptomyces sp. NPDC048254 TaxID=3365525 RepID=UPI0037229CF1